MGDAALLSVHLESVSSELLRLHSSEKQLQGFVDELQQEAQVATEKAQNLEAQIRQDSCFNTTQIQDLKNQLQHKSHELQELKQAHNALQQDLSEQQSSHQSTVMKLQGENTASICKLKEMAEQVEWLCEQQRNWICCIKRFKDCLNDEKESLVLQVNRLQEELADLRQNPKSEAVSEEELQPTMHCNSWDENEFLDLQVEANRWRGRYQELFSKFTCQSKKQWSEDGYVKPP